MHSYLRAIGFSQLKKESEVEKLLADVYHNFDHRDAIRDEDTAFIELEKVMLRIWGLCCAVRSIRMDFTVSIISHIIRGAGSRPLQR